MAVIKKYHAEILAIESSLNSIFTVEFGIESGSFKYHPGQFLHLAIDDSYDGAGQWPDSRCFSIRSNPQNQTLKITYSSKGRFTSMMMKQLKIGSLVWLKLPYGNLFTQPHNKNNTVFIAGGTGITPFLSLFSHESFLEYSNPRLYLGFKSDYHNIYKSELDSIMNNSCEVNFFYENSVGMIDIDLIFKKNGVTNSYFISGPPIMIKNFKSYLVNRGVEPSRILTDDWE